MDGSGFIRYDDQGRPVFTDDNRPRAVGISKEEFEARQAASCNCFPSSKMGFHMKGGDGCRYHNMDLVLNQNEEKGHRPEDQPLPIPNDQPYAHEAAAKILLERAILGEKRYGTKLQPFNGRDYLTDAIEEAADLLAYLVGLRMERDGVQDGSDGRTATD